MVESSFCPSCSSPVLPGEHFCARCGAALDGTARAAPRGEVPETTAADLRLAALGLAQDTSAAAPVETPSATTAASQSSPLPIPSTTIPRTPGSLAEPSGSAETHVPGGYLAPSATYRAGGWTLPESGSTAPSGSSDSSGRPANPTMSVSIGAVPVTTAGPGSTAASTPPAPTWPPTADESSPADTSAPPAPPLPAVAASVQGSPASEAVATSHTESVQELVAFGLVAAGGVVGFASFFLPWTGASGIGIGTVASASSTPTPNEWGWGMPATIPLLALTALVVAFAAGSDRAQLRVPKLAPIIARVTDLILPMLLGGLYFGVGLLYVTLPAAYGYGAGIFVLILGACLLTAGSLVALFFPPGDDSRPG